MLSKKISHLPHEIFNEYLSHGAGKIIEKLGKGGPDRCSPISKNWGIR